MTALPVLVTRRPTAQSSTCEPPLMSSDKATLDSLRIERGAPRAGTSSWAVVGLIVLVALVIGFFWWWKQPKPVPVQTAVARAQASDGTAKTLLNGSGYVTA